MQNEPVLDALLEPEELVEDDELFEDGGETQERRMAFLILNVGMQPSVFEVVKTLQLVEGLPLNWVDPQEYHVTLVGFYCDAEPVIQYPPFGQGYGLTASSLGVFNNEGESSLHLTIDPDMMLRDYQAMLAGLVRWNGYELSAYSEPDMWTPHITLGYAETPLESLPLLQEPVMIPTGAVALSVDALEEDEDFEILEVKSLRERLFSAINALFGRNKSFNFEGESGLKMVGSNHWIAYYTNPYEDRDKEWFSEKAIEDDILYTNETKDYPDLWFWHIPGTAMSKARAVMKAGRFAVAIGTFDETPYAQAMKRHLKKHGRKYTLSHGFTFPRTAFRDGVYHSYHTFEISVLPAEKASNPMTFFAVEEGNNMSTKAVDPIALENFRKALEGTGLNADAIVEAGLRATKEADEATGHNYKGESEMEAGTKEAIDGLRADIQALTAVLTVNTKAAAVPKGDAEDEETEGEAEDQMKPKKKATEEKSAADLRFEAMEAKLKAFEEREAQKAQTVQGAQIASILGDYMAQGGAQNQKAADMPFGMGAMKAMKAMGVED